MTRARPPLLVCALLALACDGPAPSRYDGGAPSDGASSDAGRDAGASGLPIPEPSALPIGAADVLRLGPGLDLDVTSALSIDEEGAVTLVFDSFGRAFTYGELWSARSTDGRSMPIPRPIGFTGRELEASPSLVRGSLYFAAANDVTSAPALYRGVVGAPEMLPDVPGVTTLLSWPRLAAWEDRVVIAFRDGASRAMLAAGDDATSFGAPVQVGPDEGVALASVGVFGDGSRAYAYQHPVGAERMVSFVRRSSDAATWSDPVRVSDASSNVHDTGFVARADGGLDLYYVYPAGLRGFVLFRRALMPDGTMGAEEQVSALDALEPSKPSGLRLPSGRVLVAFADIAERGGAGGEPTRQDLVLTSLPSEAPAP